MLKTLQYYFTPYRISRPVKLVAGLLVVSLSENWPCNTASIEQVARKLLHLKT